MNRFGVLAAKEAAVAPGLGASLPPSAAPGSADGPAGRTLLSRAPYFLVAAPLQSLVTAPLQRLRRSAPSAREGVWVNTAQPPDDPEASWPSTVFNPFANESGEMIVPTGHPSADVMPSPAADGVACQFGPAHQDGRRRPLMRRSQGRHAAPSASITGRLRRGFIGDR